MDHKHILHCIFSTSNSIVFQKSFRQFPTSGVNLQHWLDVVWLGQTPCPHHYIFLIWIGCCGRQTNFSYFTFEMLDGKSSEPPVNLRLKFGILVLLCVQNAGHALLARFSNVHLIKYFGTTSFFMFVAEYPQGILFHNRSSICCRSYESVYFSISYVFR